MQTATPQGAESTQAENHAAFVPLDRETRPAVDTAAAAHYLNRRPQTLRGWACLENGPLRPNRVNGRLAWPVAEIRKLMGAVPSEGGAK